MNLHIRKIYRYYFVNPFVWSGQRRSVKMLVSRVMVL